MPAAPKSDLNKSTALTTRNATPRNATPRNATHAALEDAIQIIPLSDAATYAQWTGARNYRARGVLTAIEPIAHFGESKGGTRQSLNRMLARTADGRSVYVPFITGNSWRGQLRRKTAIAAIALLEEALGAALIRFRGPLYTILFGGGSLKGSDSRIDLSLERDLRFCLPALSVLGCASSNGMTRGKLQVKNILPICAELARFLPEEHRSRPHAGQNVRDQTGDFGFTHSDPAKDSTLALRYLVDEDRERLAAPKVTTITDHETGEVRELAAAPGTAVQMRYGVEAFPPGTEFSAALTLTLVSDLEYEAFLAGLRLWADDAHLGGIVGKGFGAVEVDMPEWVRTDPLAPLRGEIIVPDRPDGQQGAHNEPFGVAYRQHVHDHARDIVALLQKLA